MSIKIYGNGGGSVELVADPTLATDEVVEISNGHGIESGAGYTKFPDGTLMCYGVVTLAETGGYTHIASAMSNYPVFFVGDFPSATMAITSMPTGEDARNNSLIVIADNLYKFDGIYVSSGSPDISSMWGRKVRYSAIGRWK